ncbi:hypothetical protein BAE44_0012993 [Dichanthelium oligosanthes]|uniref:Uncharacterized protein n=1 Tax=Dichanthelium oligosanthes TaxID=888268 RepID=A0A1E5VLN7_9POAL|nr:hypothetical protein BAE44_0012993 [Dichanthelium oligosanthes]
MMRITTPQPQQQPGRNKAVAVVCLQAQHVAGLPAAAEGRQVLLRLVQQPHQPAAAAAAMCRAGMAAFHDQVLLLHCAPVSSMDAVVVAVAVTVDGSRQHDTTAVEVNLAEQLRRPSPSVLSLVLSGAAATTTSGAVLSLTLHHRQLIARPEPHRRYCACMAADMLLSCLRVPLPPRPPPAAAEDENGLDYGDDSSGFITIEKGAISRRRPPSDNLPTTTDDDEAEADGGMKKPSVMSWRWSSLNSSKVEEEFLAMLDDGGDDLLNLDALVEDAGAELAARRR